MTNTLTPQLLAAVAGIILSLIFSYIPGLNAKFAMLENVYKRLIMLLLTFLTALGIFGLSCAGVFNYVTCDKGGAWLLLGLFIQVAVANQSAYQITPDAPVVTEIKLAQKQVEVETALGAEAGVDNYSLG